LKRRLPTPPSKRDGARGAPHRLEPHRADFSSALSKCE
jgi:hypothetical protein